MCRCSNCGWLEVNPSGAMFCGYSDERTWENESCIAWKDKNEPQTNADRIRSMTDEDLAKYLAWLADEQACYEWKLYDDTDRITKCLDFLKKEG